MKLIDAAKSSHAVQRLAPRGSVPPKKASATVTMPMPSMKKSRPLPAGDAVNPAHRDFGEVLVIDDTENRPGPWRVAPVSRTWL